MSDFSIGLWSFPVLLTLIFARIPIGLAMLIMGVCGTWLVNGTAVMTLSQLKTLTFGTFSNYSLSIIPLFLLMGQFATIGGLSRGLFKAAEAWLGHLRGGVAMAAIGACAGFGAICGSSLATAATMGQVALPELRRHGYSGKLATATLAAGGTLGILIPPSVVLVVYAILTEQNIAKLFVAAMIPGLLAAFVYMVTIAIIVRIDGEDVDMRPKLILEARLKALAQAWPVIAIFVIVVGGIYAGLFTPTEGAAIGAAGTGLAALASRALGWSALADAILSAARNTGMIFIIILGASIFNNFLALTQVPQEAAQWVGALALSPWVILAIVLAIYVLLGCVMDSFSMILLTVPIFFPIMTQLDFGLSPEEFALWFGILVLIVVEVGLITPPVGMNLFVINAMDDTTPISQTYRGTLPFIAADIMRVLLLAACPPITLSLVWLVF